jgi:hypothetical protein
MKNRTNPEELEKFIHRTLRSLPDRHAPGTLESRVLAALEARAAIPWWHKSWTYWPLWVRSAFLVLCAGIAGLVVYAGIYIESGFDAVQTSGTLVPALAVANRILDIGRGFVDFAMLVARNIPSLWIYGAIAFIAGLYAMLFGLGAAAYRSLWAHR